MDVKEAVRTAKQFVTDILQDERVTNLGLEEIEHDDRVGAWNVTWGFSRPWNTNGPYVARTFSTDQDARRDYRVVKVSDADGKVLSVKLREPTA